jgi:endo-1,4-beta-xylanase
MNRTLLLTMTAISIFSAAATAQEIAIDRDIEYGTGLHLDLYRSSVASGPAPVVLWLHGESILPGRITPAAALTSAGYAVASIDYRSSSQILNQVDDTRAAIRFLRANAAKFNLDHDHIAAMGFGSGGRLAALLADGPDRVQAVIDLAATLPTIPTVTKEHPPTYILHGTADSTASTENSQRFISALKVAGVPATLDLRIGAHHDTGELLSAEAMSGVVTFLNQALRGAKANDALSPYLATPLTEYIDPVALDINGTLYRTYPTPARGPNTFASYRIYLPPDYAANPTRRYPVIYFLHGANVDSKRPVTSGYIARIDAAIRSGVMPPTIVVVPQGLNQGWWVDSKDGKQPMESVFIKNLIPFIDASYRTIATREARAIEGHSMGGFGALHNGFNNPDLFIAVTGNSPAMVDPVNRPPAPGGANTYNFFKFVYGDDKDYFHAMWPTTLAEKNAAKIRQQQIRVICGTADALFPGAQAVDAELTKLNIPHEFLPVQNSPHNHDQLLQYESFDTMAFYGKVFAKFK